MWPDVYSSSVKGLSNIRQIDEDKDTEDSARNVREKYGIKEGQEPAKTDYYHDFYNESEIELDSSLLYELQIALKDYPEKVIIRQMKGRAIEIKSVVTSSHS